MKNRASKLCLENKISSVETYARLIGVSIDFAYQILAEKAVLTEDVINANCNLFNVSKAYFLNLI